MEVKFKAGFSHIVGFAIFLVFLVLKLIQKIDWSWFWVIFPLWLPWAISIIFYTTLYLILEISDHHK